MAILERLRRRPIFRRIGGLRAKGVEYFFGIVSLVYDYGIPRLTVKYEGGAKEEDVYDIYLLTTEKGIVHLNEIKINPEYNEVILSFSEPIPNGRVEAETFYIIPTR